MPLHTLKRIIIKNLLNMKKTTKIILALVMVIACASTASAQFRFGIKAGINVNELHLNQKTFDKDNGCGFTGGVMVEFTVPVIGIGIDGSVMYTYMNNSIDIPASSGDLISSIKSEAETNVGKNFIEIPINLKYKLTIPAVEKLIKPYIFTGPTFAFKLDKNTLDSFKTKTCQTAWNVGLGVELLNHLQIGASYGFGMNNVADKVFGVDAEKLKVKNNYWTVTAAYLF